MTSRHSSVCALPPVLYTSVLSLRRVCVLAELLDAHAVWHGSTIPLGFLFWTFLTDDAREELAFVRP
jgi:hypothetical protein